MDAVDRSLSSRNYAFCRYVDDILIFCPTKDAAEIAIFECAEILDRHQRLALQKKKVEILTAAEFRERATRMMVNQPMNPEEEELLKIIRKHAGGSPYRNISLDNLTDDELKTLRSTDLESLLELYLTSVPVNYPRLAWLLRRLSQVAAPGGIKFVLQNISSLTPVLGDVGRYIVRAASNYETSALESAGTAVLDSLELPLLNHSEYMQMVLLNLFARVPALDHTNRLTSRYQAAGAAARREIVSAAAAANAYQWLKERKDEFGTSDPWLRSAIIAAAACFPGDEAKFWLRRVKRQLTPVERFVARWATGSTAAELGEQTLS